MTKHARPEIFVPMVKTLADQTRVPVAMILDHGRDWEKITWAYRMGFSSVMIDASAYGFEENVARTRKVVVFNSCRDRAKSCLLKNPDMDYMSLMMEVEGACRGAVKHFISLTGSAGRGGDFAPTYSFCHDISKIETGAGE